MSHCLGILCHLLFFGESMKDVNIKGAQPWDIRLLVFYTVQALWVVEPGNQIICFNVVLHKLVRVLCCASKNNVKCLLWPNKHFKGVSIDSFWLPTPSLIFFWTLKGIIFWFKSQKTDFSVQGQKKVDSLLIWIPLPETQWHVKTLRYFIGSDRRKITWKLLWWDGQQGPRARARTNQGNVSRAREISGINNPSEAQGEWSPP